ncbi:MAG: hypothetical protein KJZ75_11325 [Hyphomonadaceae bacterium]|nr:hypothetical protein [Hyphomonadaceae bacterium]
MAEAWNQHGPECPKCNHVISADEPYHYSDDYTEDTCPKCNAKFSVSVEQTVAWSTEIDDEEACSATAPLSENTDLGSK